MTIYAAILASLMAGTPVQPLPDHLVIPEGQSTVICPSTDAAQTMLAQYHKVKPAPNNYTIDTDLFFAGLSGTGCSQDNPDRTGDVLMQTVINRTQIVTAGGPERYLVYRGVNQRDGKPLIGIVSEDGNNSYARTELAQFMIGRSADGWLDARSNDPETLIFYRCDTPAQASAVLGAVAGMENAPTKSFRSKLKKELSVQKCRPAQDRYFVTALRGEAGNNCGDECFIALTALEAVDRSGMGVSLIYDASLM
jgi:hypothetical protein